MTKCSCESRSKQLESKYRILQANYSRISSAVQGDFRSVQEYLSIMQNQRKTKNELEELRMTLQLLSFCKDKNFFTPGSMNNELAEGGFLPEHLLGASKESIWDTPCRNRRCASNSRNICGDSCNEIPFRGLSDGSIECEPECGNTEPESNQRSGKRILVYGFQEKLLPLIETLFCQIGHITSYEVSHIGTWIAICYAEDQDANRALARHLTVVQGAVIGVTDKPTVIRQALAANRKLTSSSSRTASPPIKRLGTSRTESSSRSRLPKRVTGWAKLLENVSNF